MRVFFYIRWSSSLGEAANANLDEQAYPQCIGGVLSVMHDFNSVSGMWSDSQLKGRGGQERGEGTNEEGIETEEEEGQGAWGDSSAGERVWGVAFLHIRSCLRGFGKW